ncbi:MAG: CocE/NonD family hydrolase [bacterium]
MKSIVNYSILMFSVLLLTTSCAHIPYRGIKGELKMVEEIKDVSPFNYAKEDFPVEVKLVRRKKGYVIKKVTFPSALPAPGENNTVRAYYYQAEKEGRLPAIVILPIAGGNYFFSKKMAKFLVRRGMNCLRLERVVRLLDSEADLEIVRRRFIKTIVDAKRSIDWLVSQKEIDSERIGVTGASLGAFLSPLVAETDPRIKSSVFILGGGNLTKLFSQSREKTIRTFRKRVMKKEGLTEEEFSQLVSQKLRDIDPLLYAGRLSPETVLMINTVNDVVVPRDCTLEFWSSVGEPELIWLPFTHIASFFAFGYARGKAFQHFQRTLSVGE